MAIKIVKSVKIDSDLLVRIKDLSSLLNKSEHAYIIDSIKRSVDLDFEEHKDSLYPPYFIPEDTCKKSGYYVVLFWNFSGDSLSSFMGELSSQQNLTKNDIELQKYTDKMNDEFHNSFEGKEVDGESLIGDVLSLTGANRDKKVLRIIHLNKGDLFPAFKPDEQANCYESLTDLDDKRNYSPSSGLQSS